VDKDRTLPRHIGFFLIPEFPISAVIPASEALRNANHNSGRTLFDRRFISVDGGPVRAGNGMLVTPASRSSSRRTSAP
jgi:transcriptional regulator GlxA family with amidase domain